MGREKGEGEDSGELEGMGWVGWRKGRYGIREVYTSTKGVILMVYKRLEYKGDPRSKERSPDCSLDRREGALAHNHTDEYLHITIEPSSGDGWRRRRRPTLEHWT